MMNSFFVVKQCTVDSVDNERCPTDNERHHDQYQCHRDVSLLLVNFVFIDRRTVSQMSPVRAYLSQHPTCIAALAAFRTTYLWKCRLHAKISQSSYVHKGAPLQCTYKRLHYMLIVACDKLFTRTRRLLVSTHLQSVGTVEITRTDADLLPPLQSGFRYLGLVL